MWFFGSSLFSKSNDGSDISPNQINRLIDSWETGSYDRAFLEDLCYGGIPVCYRGAIWNLLAGNFLQITPELYKIFRERSIKLSSNGANSTDGVDNVDLEAGNMQGKEDSIGIIRYDVPRTFVEINDFHNNGPLAKNLELILQTYACYRPDVGYVQGMSYIAAMLVYYLDEFNAFKSFANVLGRRMSFDFYQLNNETIHQFTRTFNFFFELHLPRLYIHFQSEDVSSDVFLLDWALTIFSKTFPVDIAARIWDVYLLEGEVFVMRVAIGVLKVHHETLKTMECPNIIKFLKRPPDGSTCPIQLMSLVRSISISKDAYDAIMSRSKNQCHSRKYKIPVSTEDTTDTVSNLSISDILCPPFGNGSCT